MLSQAPVFSGELEIHPKPDIPDSPTNHSPANTLKVQCVEYIISRRDCYCFVIELFNSIFVSHGHQFNSMFVLTGFQATSTHLLMLVASEKPLLSWSLSPPDLYFLSVSRSPLSVLVCLYLDSWAGLIAGSRLWLNTPAIINHLLPMISSGGTT